MIGNFEIKQRDLNLMPDVVNTSDLSSICSVLFCLPSFQFNSLADFANESVWIQSVAYQYVFPLHNLVESTRNSEDIELREGRDNRRVKSRDGKYRFMFNIVCDIDYYIRLKEYEGRDLKCFLGDINKNLIGHKVGTTVLPLTIDSIWVNRIELGANQPAWTTIYLDLNDPSEINYSIKPAFEFEDIKNVMVTIDNFIQIDADSITFDVTDPLGEGIEGLTVFTVVDEINGSVAVSSLVDNGGGNYRINAAENLYEGTVTLITTLYNAIGIYSFAIPQYNPTQYSSQYDIS